MPNTIAIIGLNGTLGGPVIDGLLNPAIKSQISLPIRAVTRDASSKTSTSDVKYYQASSKAEYAQAFKGADVVVDLRAGFEPLPNDVIDAADEAGVKVYIPSEFGSGEHPWLSATIKDKTARREYADTKKFKTVIFQNSLFADWLIAGISSTVFGINIKEGTYTTYKSQNEQVSVSFLKDIGNAVAGLISLPIDKIPTLVKVQSDNISANQFAELYEKSSGKTLKRIQGSEEELKAAVEKIVADGPANVGDIFVALTATNILSNANNFKDDNADALVNRGNWFTWTKFAPAAEKAWGQQ